MKTLRILAVLIVLLALVIYVQNNLLGQKTNNLKKTPSLSPSPSPSASPTPEILQDIFQNSQSPTPIPTNPPSQNLQSLTYPNSVVISSNFFGVSLESTDNPQTITNWYKEKIKAMGLNANSFVQTNANDNVLNKLVASNGKVKISVEIKKQSNDPVTKISVSF